MSIECKKPGIFDARISSPRVAWLIFYRAKPKEIPQLIHVAGNVAEALIIQVAAAKKLKVPERKIECVMYVPASSREVKQEAKLAKSEAHK